MARPRRIVLVRHGESEGNADDTVYEREPDHALPLTATRLAAGRGDGRAAAGAVRRRARQRLRLAVPPHPPDLPGASASTPTWCGSGRSRGCASRTGGTGRTGGRTAAEGVPRRLRPLLLPLRPGRVRRRRVRPGRRLPGEPVPQLRGPRPPAERAAGHARADHAAVLHALVPLVGRGVRVAVQSRATPRRGCWCSATDGRYTLDRPFERWRTPGAVRRHRIEWQGDDR